MKVYVVYTQEVGLDYYDLDNAKVFLDREKAEECRESYLFGENAEGFEDACIYGYEVVE